MGMIEEEKVEKKVEEKPTQVHSECGKSEGCQGCSCISDVAAKIKEERKNKTVCLDFDGVIHSYTSRWTKFGINEIKDPPVEGAFYYLKKLLYGGFKVAVFSCRSHNPGGTDAIKQWFIKHGFKAELLDNIEFPTSKPPAILYIDDRGYQFEGKFPKLSYIDSFQPWYKREPEESNLTRHARKELELIGAFTKEGDFYGGMTGEAVMELIKVFSAQGHSGMSASIVRQIFDKLANYDTISPLTYEDDEWNETHLDDGNKPHFQNKRNSAVFKAGKDGQPYYSEAYYKKTQTGGTWSGSLELSNDWRIRCCRIRPENKELKKFCIDVLEREVEKDNEAVDCPGSGWWVMPLKDISQVKELAKYYQLELHRKDGKVVVCK